MVGECSDDKEDSLTKRGGHGAIEILLFDSASCASGYKRESPGTELVGNTW